MIDVVIAVVWVAFWIYWLGAALGTKARRPGSRVPGMPFRLGLPLLLFLAFRSPLLRGRSLAVHNEAAQAVGLVILLLGLAVAVWARINLGTNWGTPMSQRADPELVTSGPYRHVRHPIYSGILLGMIGTAVAVDPVWFAVVVVVAAYFVYSATVEERLMSAQFPAEYAAYRRRTRMLVPFIF